MRNRKKIYSLLLLAAIFTVMFSTVAFASDLGMGSDATVDILGGDRFSGAVQWVNKIGKFVDNWFMAFISFVSFFIISASCLRNVLAGAYCVFPKFWDKVDEAHKNAQDISISSIQSYFTGGQWKGTSTGSVTQFLLRLLPNIKVLTDFENAQDPDYKQYFMRAIPQCVVAVFVGVFIYNGYYRDVMIVTSQFGSRLTMNALTSIKPDDILYKLSNISGVPDYAIKDAPYGTDAIADGILKEAAKSIRGTYDDQSEKNNKTVLYNELSRWLHDKCATEFSKYSDTDVWHFSVGSGTMQSGNPPERTSYDSMDGSQINKYIVIPVNELALNTERHKGETWYFGVMVTLTNVGANANANDIAITDFILTLPYPTNMESTYTASGSGGAIKSSAGSDVTIGGVKAKVGVGKITFESLPSGKEGEVMLASNLFYASTLPSKDFIISGVVFKNGVTPQLSSSTTGITIPIGGNIQDAWLKKKNANALPDSTTAAADDEEGGSDLEEGAD